jgi:hypothetical protein
LPAEVNTLDRDGSYYLLEDVALYIHLYEQLPPNYITKSEARALGWDSQAGDLWEVAPGCVIGGDRFGNNEGLLPEAEGRDYYECDVNYDGGYRDEERIVYSDDGLIFYRELKKFAVEYLLPGGLLIMEHGFDQKKAMHDIFDNSPLYVLQTLKDYAGHDRISIVVKK